MKKIKLSQYNQTEEQQARELLRQRNLFKQDKLDKLLKGNKK